MRGFACCLLQASQLTEEELEQLAALVVEAFVRSLPDSPPEAAAAGSITQRVTTQVLRGAPLSASCVVPGVAVEIDPESMPYGLQHVGCEEPVEVGVLLVSTALDGGAVDPALSSQAPSGAADGPFRIVVEEALGALGEFVCIIPSARKRVATELLPWVACDSAQCRVRGPQ